MQVNKCNSSCTGTLTSHAFCVFGIAYGPCKWTTSTTKRDGNKVHVTCDGEKLLPRRNTFGRKSLPTLCSAPLSTLMCQQPRRRPKSPGTWHALASPNGPCTPPEGEASCKQGSSSPPGQFLCSLGHGWDQGGFFRLLCALCQPGEPAPAMGSCEQEQPAAAAWPHRSHPRADPRRG